MLLLTGVSFYYWDEIGLGCFQQVKKSDWVTF